MTFIFAILLSTAALASDKDSFEKTYPRDNTFCLVDGKRVEIMIRGDQSHTEPKERMWGEHVFARLGTQTPYRLPVTERSGLYRLFQGNPSSCTKSIGTMNDGKFMILFQKLNSPHKHQLVIQYLDPVSLKPVEHEYSPYLADKVLIRNNGLVMRTHAKARSEIQMGKVQINGKKFIYQDHEFPVWISVTGKESVIDPQLTFENFRYRSFFKTSADFNLMAGWNENTKSFKNNILYVAINHQTKTKCVVMLETVKTPDGSEGWICQ